MSLTNAQAHFGCESGATLVVINKFTVVLIIEINGIAIISR
jgi:hypothetical protein